MLSLLRSARFHRPSAPPPPPTPAAAMPGPRSSSSLLSLLPLVGSSGRECSRVRIWRSGDLPPDTLMNKQSRQGVRMQRTLKIFYATVIVNLLLWLAVFGATTSSD